MKVTETYNKGCDYCGATGFVNYRLPQGQTSSQYSNVCPVCKGSGVVIVTREYEIPDLPPDTIQIMSPRIVFDAEGVNPYDVKSRKQRKNK